MTFSSTESRHIVERAVIQSPGRCSTLNSNVSMLGVPATSLVAVVCQSASFQTEPEVYAGMSSKSSVNTLALEDTLQPY